MSFCTSFQSSSSKQKGVKGERPPKTKPRYADAYRGRINVSTCAIANHSDKTPEITTRTHGAVTSHLHKHIYLLLQAHTAVVL